MITREAVEKLINGTPSERRFLCSENFELFMLYYFPEYIKYPFAPFHFDMFQDVKDLFGGTIREVAWIMFRESAKTSISKILLVWIIVYNKRR